MQHSRYRIQCPHAPIVPLLLGGRTFPRVFASFLIVGLAIVAGEWILHQTVYLLVYGSMFGVVMQSTAHHVYIGTLGWLIGAAALSFLLTTAVLLRSLIKARRRLSSSLSPALHLRLTRRGVLVPWLKIPQTALLLACFQVSLYGVQENLEGFAATQTWPGIGVIFSFPHIIVLPVDVVVASCISLVLWALYSTVYRARRLLQIVETLVALFARRDAVPPALHPSCTRAPHTRLVSPGLYLRAPPSAA